MQYKSYGKTGKSISVISFGGMQFENPEDIDTSAEIVLHAYKQGVNYFDTCPGYCKDKSEDIFGAAIKQMEPGSYYVSTKCSRPDGDELRKSLEKSLKRLGVQRIDFFHIWCVVTLDQWAERKTGGAVAAALKAKDEGLIGHLCVSSHLPGDQLREVLEEGYFEGVTLGYSAINFPYRAKALDAAEEMNLGVVTMNPLGGGLIPQNPNVFGHICQPGDKSIVEAAIRFNVSHSAITSALVGFSNKQHVDEAVAAVENFQLYDQQRLDEIKQNIHASFDNLCTGCGYCLPCPQGVNIPRLMDAYNRKILGDGDDQKIIDRLANHWSMKPSAAKECTQCGECEKKCTQHLPICERMKEIAEL